MCSQKFGELKNEMEKGFSVLWPTVYKQMLINLEQLLCEKVSMTLSHNRRRECLTSLKEYQVCVYMYVRESLWLCVYVYQYLYKGTFETFMTSFMTFLLEWQFRYINTFQLNYFPSLSLSLASVIIKVIISFIKLISFDFLLWFLRDLKDL